MTADSIADLVLSTEPRLDEPLDTLRAILESMEPAFAPHPLGFLRCRLGQSRRGVAHLHCWPGHERFRQSDELNVHRHSVTVASLVLVGELTDATYAWRSDKSGVSRLYAQDLARPTAGLMPTDEVGTAFVVDTSRRSAGERYVVSQGAYHKTEVNWGTLIVTVAVFMSEAALVPLVVGPKAETQPVTYEAPTFDNEALVARLAALPT